MTTKRIYKKKINYEAEEKVNKMYREDIEKTDQIDRVEFDGIENEETSIIEKEKKKNKCKTLRNSKLMIKAAKQILSSCNFESTRFQCM
ncbi:8804_t:CDS:2, partial [Cetraspora pellucida]